MKSYLQAILSSASLSLLVLLAGCNSATPFPTPTSTPIPDLSALSAQIEQAAHDTVKSTDGSAELLIPSGALPSGVTASKLGITLLNPSTSGFTLNDQPPLFAYQFAPDGLQFAMPAVLRISTALPTDGSVPVLYLSSGGKSTELDTSIEIDQTNRQVMMSALITHFSEVSGFRGRFLVEVPDPGVHFVGDTFEVVATVHRLSHTWVVKPVIFNEVYHVTMDQEWKLQGDWTTDALPSIDPASFIHQPPTTSVTDDQFIVSTPFTCVKTGKTKLTYHVFIEFDDVTKETGTSVYTYATLSVPNQVVCEAAPPAQAPGPGAVPPTRTPTNTPTDTPTNTPTDTPTYTPTNTPTNTVTGTPTGTPTNTPTATSTPLLLQFKRFLAHFDSFTKSTYYTVTASGDGLTYAWSLSNTEAGGNPCGTFTPNSPADNQAIWKHPDVPGGCPKENVHPGVITFVIRDSHGAAITCQYNRGSADGDTDKDITPVHCFR
jgi:hypothetical protein